MDCLLGEMERLRTLGDRDTLLDLRLSLHILIKITYLIIRRSNLAKKSQITYKHIRSRKVRCN